MKNGPELAVNRRKRFLSKTSDVEIRLALALPHTQSLGALVEAFVTSSKLPLELRKIFSDRNEADGQVLKNIRGWRVDERENASEELLHLEGKIQSSEDPTPFLLRLSTKFSAFENTSIDYGCARQLQLSVPLFFHSPSARDLCRAVPATLSVVAIGLERFRFRQSFSFGGAPGVSSQFHLRIGTEELNWHWTFEFDGQPLEDSFPEVGALSETFRTFGLYSSLENEISARIGTKTHHP